MKNQEKKRSVDISKLCRQEGYLWKKSNLKWQKRYYIFVLDGRYCLYYKQKPVNLFFASIFSILTTHPLNLDEYLPRDKRVH